MNENNVQFKLLEGELDGLNKLIKLGYNSQGMNYGCGCALLQWTKGNRLIAMRKDWCEEHGVAGGPMERK